MVNQIKTALLLALLSGLLILLGNAIGGSAGIFIGLGFAFLMNIASYWYSDKIVLHSYGAKEASATKAPVLHSMVRELSQKANIPMPRLAIVPEETPNAFATGRNPENAVVAVTEGLLQTLPPHEIRAVLAHEIGHIANRDILIQSVAGLLATVVTYAANMVQWITFLGGSRDSEGGSNIISTLLLALLAPIAAVLIQFSISRSREYLADEAGALLCGNPLHLASALSNLHTCSQRIPMHHGSQATAHMFIVNPFSGSSFARLFSTHPPVEERIARLQRLAGSR